MRLLVVFVASLCGSTIAQQLPAVCSTVHQGEKPNAPPLPGLPMTAFKSVVRAVIMNKNYTADAIEYVDESANAAALVLTNQGQQITIVMNYNSGQSYYVMPNPSSASAMLLCAVQNLTTDTNNQLFGLPTASNASSTGMHLFSTAKILNFVNGTEVYKGRSTLPSGIPVNRWSSCVYWPELNSNFTLDYYFTVPNYTTPSGLDQVPVKAEVQGETHYSNGTVSRFHHVYQYVNFAAYVNDPETKFETPPGVYCEGRVKSRTMPKLRNHFYYREEIVDPGADTGGTAILSEADIWYDYDVQIIRFDTRSAPDGTAVDFSTSLGPFSTIHDYNSGVQYTIDRYSGKCSIDPIPATARGFDSTTNGSSTTLSMRGPMKFFNLDDSSYQYAGVRTARGVQCDVFQATLTNLPGQQFVIYEVYFTRSAQEVTDRGDNTAASSSVPIRIMEWVDGALKTEYNIHDFDQDTPRYRVFDVTSCFPGTQAKYFELFLKIGSTGPNNQDMMVSMSPYLDGLLHMNMALTMQVAPIRIQNARMHWDQWNVYYQATLLDSPPSIAKYQFNQGKSMASNAGKVIPNVANKLLCAQDCDNHQEWDCKEFDYCQSTLVCTIGRSENSVSDPSTWRNSSACDHYSRVLNGGSVRQTPLGDAWMALKNSVYQKTLVLTLPLPDSSGKVDLTADTSTLDVSQKVTFSGFFLTDQVVSQTQNSRNPVTSMAMSQFTVIPRHMGKGSDTVIRGVSVDDCASSCVNEQTYMCQSFHYCWEAGSCFLSRRHPDEQPDLLRNTDACDLYFRNYTSNFQQFAGVTLLSGSDTIYQNVISPNQCAKLCTYYKSFHCESFDFCSDVNTCYLGRSHYYDKPRSNLPQMPSCSHYSRNYLSDFVAKAQKVVALRDNRIIQNVSPQQCARLCSQEPSFTCQSFDYCGNLTECRLSDASVADVGQVSLVSSALCDVYQRQFGSGATSSAQTSSSSSSGYSAGAMGGIAFGMLVVGLIVGAIIIFAVGRFRGGGGGGDGMNIAFSKTEADS